MKVFVVNCGSSSIKYQLFSMAEETVLAKGVVERVGTAEAELKHKAGQNAIRYNIDAPNHKAGIQVILETLVDPRVGVLESVDQIEGVGHRVVHGGQDATQSTRIDESILKIIENNVELAPLHNPANLEGIAATMEAMPDVPQIAVFDTAFLSTLPEHAYRYAIPEDWYENYRVRKYGFHGTSHRYVTFKAAELLGRPVEDTNLITCHLGNGCSITAVKNGRAIDHSMGMTPLAGVVMGTRSGDIDPAIPLHMINMGLEPSEVDKMLNKRSGLLGVSDDTNDMRDLLELVDQGDKKATLAIELFVYSILKYIGSYTAVLPRVDAIVLTGGIGENSLPVRERLCAGLANLGATADLDRNLAMSGGKAGPITANGSKLPVWIIPTNEELMIARDTRRLVAQG